MSAGLFRRPPAGGKAVNNSASESVSAKPFYKQSVREIAVTLSKMNAKIFIRGLRDSRFSRWNMARSDGLASPAGQSGQPTSQRDPSAGQPASSPARQTSWLAS